KTSTRASRSRPANRPLKTSEISWSPLRPRLAGVPLLIDDGEPQGLTNPYVRLSDRAMQASAHITCVKPFISRPRSQAISNSRLEMNRGEARLAAPPMLQKRILKETIRARRYDQTQRGRTRAAEPWCTAATGSIATELHPIYQNRVVPEVQRV